jgi:hypothetical protein
MPAFIFLDDPRGEASEILFWNFKARRWQSDLGQGCIYSTMDAALRTAHRKVDELDLGPVQIGTHCLRDYWKHGYRKTRLRMT